MERLTAVSVDESVHGTDFLRFSAQASPPVGRARPAEVRETRIQFDSRTPLLFVARGESHEPITRHLPTRRLSTSNRSIRISSAIFVLVRFAMLRKWIPRIVL